MLTIKRILEKEKEYCYMLASTDPDDDEDREEIMEGIRLCQK